MSKTSQRKRTMFDIGLKDGCLGKLFRWTKHPLIGSYRAGFRLGWRERNAKLNYKWKPVWGEPYWSIDSLGNITEEVNHNFKEDHSRIRLGNAFKSKQEAVEFTDKEVDHE